MLEKIIMADHHGFCMGVKRAISIAEETSDSVSGEVTILNEIVHNEVVVEKFNQRGVGQSTSVEAVKSGTLIISAHGIAPAVIEQAKAKGLNVVDATCPLVERIYVIVKKAVKAGFHIIHYGESNHDETHGIVGHAPDHITVASSLEELLALPAWEDRQLGLTVQTTAHVSEFEKVQLAAKEKWPHLEIFNTICNATTQRQSAILDLAPKVDMVLVVGSQTSANSKRLALLSDSICGRGILIGSVAEIDDAWFAPSENIVTVGVSAGASTPDFLVEEVIKRLQEISGGKAQVILPVKKKRIRNVAKSAS